MDGMLGDVRFLLNSNMVVEVSSGDFKLASSFVVVFIIRGCKICNMFNNIFL